MLPLLGDGEGDLGLVEPAGVPWGGDENQVWPCAREAIDGALLAMRRAVVDDQGHALRFAVGLLGDERPSIKACLEQLLTAEDVVLPGADPGNFSAPRPALPVTPSPGC